MSTDLNALLPLVAPLVSRHSDLAIGTQLARGHEIHYYIGQGSESFGGGQGSSAIAAWVATHFKKQTVGGETDYDLTQPVSGTA